MPFKLFYAAQHYFILLSLLISRSPLPTHTSQEQVTEANQAAPCNMYSPAYFIPSQPSTPLYPPGYQYHSQPSTPFSEYQYHSLPSTPLSELFPPYSPNFAHGRCRALLNSYWIPRLSSRICDNLPTCTHAVQSYFYIKVSRFSLKFFTFSVK